MSIGKVEVRTGCLPIFIMIVLASLMVNTCAITQNTNEIKDSLKKQEAKLDSLIKVQNQY